MSKCTKSKQEDETCAEEWNGNLFCLARGQIEQSKTLLLLQKLISNTIGCNKASLCEKGWPNLLCHTRLIYYRSIVTSIDRIYMSDGRQLWYDIKTKLW